MTAAREQREIGRTAWRPGAGKAFTPTASAVREAREYVAAQLPPGPAADIATLLVSELATNAVEHAQTNFEVRVESSPLIHVEVADYSKVLPVQRELPVDAEGGRGLLIVEAMAVTWGTKETDVGKVVWFRLDGQSPD